MNPQAQKEATKLLQTKYINEKLVREDLLPIKELIRSYFEGSESENFA